MTRRLVLAVLALVFVVAGGAARAAVHTHAATARAGIVVIDTMLGYEGGEVAGTGMVLTSSGEVLTNNHVIRGATSISVLVPQTGRRYSAVVLGYDVAADTALLRLKNASGLGTVKLQSAKVMPGQPVTGVGNAGGTGRLTTAPGTVTALGRTITVSDDQGGTQRLRGLIQTSTSLRPGDSGGPLLDASGHVVGMDTAASSVNSVSYSTVGVSYAIPIATALGVVRQIEYGTATAAVHVGATPWLGVSVAYGRGAGAVVAGVVPGSPADVAGLAYGDRIVAVGGHAITSPRTIVSTLLRLKPGARLAVAWVDPYGARQTSTLTLAAGPPQ